jgi:Family of unknown function (DUF5309)
MAFSGISTNGTFSLQGSSLVGEDISEIIRTLAPVEAPFLDWLGDGAVAARATKHEYVMDYLRPHYIVASTAIASATAATAFQVNGLGLALTVGTLLENESAAPEIMQVNSIIGANSINVTRNYDGVASGSLAAGGQLYVRGPAGLEGADHSGGHTAQLGLRVANTVGLFQIEIAVSGTAMAIQQLGNDSFENARAKIFRQIPSDLEKEVVRGVLNGTNSLGGTANTRTMKGIRTHLTAINSTVAANSFNADPHLYIGNVWEQAFQNGASSNETWAIVAGRTWFRDISLLNASKVQDTNAREVFKRVIREYEGPFGQCTVFLDRTLPATELLLVPKERIRVVPLENRSFQYFEIAKSGDNMKGEVVGEYTVEVHHPSAMARMHS